MHETVLFRDKFACRKLMQYNTGMAFIVSWIMIVVSAWGLWMGDLWAFTGALLVLVFHPLLDTLIGATPSQPGPDFQLFSKFNFKVLSPKFFLIGVWPLLFLFWLQSLHFLATADALTWWLGVLSSGLILGSFAITAAHELIHRSSKTERAIGRSLLWLVNFGQFEVSHLLIHHKYVATDQDPASARAGEWLYTYWLRSYFGNKQKAYQAEHQRLSAQGPIHQVLKHRMLWQLAVFALASFAIDQSLGASALHGWWALSVIAILLLQTVDYIEHYGLQRSELKPGIYESVKPKHSWDSQHALTNASLFNLGLHSDHHFQSHKEFSRLQPQPEAGRLNLGYSLLLLGCLVSLPMHKWFGENLPPTKPA